jgi:hypothetical protein
MRPSSSPSYKNHFYFITVPVKKSTEKRKKLAEHPLRAKIIWKTCIKFAVTSCKAGKRLL